MKAAINVTQMFSNCIKLTSLDLSFIYSSKITQMREMFYNCYNLKIIDMQNLDTTSVENIYNIFSGCWSLQFLNIYSFVINSDLNINNIVESLPYNIIYCLKDYDKTQDIISSMNQKSFINNCSYICNYENKKIINETNTCIDDCNQDKNHFYEFNNKCYDICPFGTKSTINNLCVESIEETTTNLIYDSNRSDTIFKEEITSQKTEGREKINISSNYIKEDISFQATENLKNSILSTLSSENIQDDTDTTKFIDSTIIQFNMETTIPITNTELKEEAYSPTEIKEDIISSSSNLKEQITISTIEEKEKLTSLTNEITEDITPQTNERKDKIETDLASTQNNIIESSIINNKLTEGIITPSEIKKDIISTNYISQDTNSNIEIITNRGSIFKDEDNFIISGICNVEQFLKKTCKENDKV
jgi:surface protein